MVWQNLQCNLTWNTIHEFYTWDSCSYACIVRRVSQNTGEIFIPFAPQITCIASNIHFFNTLIRLQPGNSKSRSASDLVELCIFSFQSFQTETEIFAKWFLLSLISLNSKICSNVMRKRCSNANKEEAKLRAVRERNSQIGFCVEARPWLLTGFVLHSPEFNSSATLVNRQTVLPPASGDS